MSISSPFKFLDAYNKEDKDIFFGREEEIEQLYNLVFQSNFTLVYGQSGTGKTSLVQCGLANRIPPSDWFNVYIRRNDDLNNSLRKSLGQYDTNVEEKGTLKERLLKRRKAAGRKVKAQDTDAGSSDLIRTLRRLYKHFLKPIYLIFDQFEELFILGNEAEQQQFYADIAEILDTEAYCRIIIIMREESIAGLYDFEKVVPQVFDKRLRVEPMRRVTTQEVIHKTCEAFEIGRENDAVADQIIDILSEGQGRVELTYLQVFMDKLYTQAAKRQSEQIIFSQALIAEAGDIEDVLADFLDNQTDEIQRELENTYTGINSKSVEKLLSSFATLEGTTQPLAKEQIKSPVLNAEQTQFAIDLLEKGRLIRFEDQLFELAHDKLALRIANKRSADEIALLQIIKLVRDRLQVYGTTNTLLNNNELNLIKSFEKRLQEEKSLSTEEWNFVKKSETANKRRRRLIMAGTVTLIAVLAAFSIFSYQQWQIAQIKEEEATNSLNQLIDEQARNRKANYEKYLAEGQASMSQSRYEQAVDQFTTALVFNDTGSVALRLKAEAEAKSNVSARFEQLMADGNGLEAQGPRAYVDALQKFQEGLDLNYDNPRAQNNIDRMRGKLEIAFDNFKRSGDTFFEARNKPGYTRALDNYRQAARIRPNDSYIQNRIRECSRLINQ
jgi:KaiC/GvpD/RAD55 family RecA-like ATPase